MMLSSDAGTVLSSSLTVCIGNASLEPYNTQGIPSWAIPIVVSLVAGTVLLPVLARKAQLKTNSRTASNDGGDLTSGRQGIEETKGSGSLYEQYYKDKK
jgi:hypothetical protein